MISGSDIFVNDVLQTSPVDVPDTAHAETNDNHVIRCDSTYVQFLAKHVSTIRIALLDHLDHFTMPILHWLPIYSHNDLIGDMSGGFSIGFMVCKYGVYGM